MSKNMCKYIFRHCISYKELIKINYKILNQFFKECK